MWMTLDSSVATTWVISRICFMQNCLEDRLFVGAFIPVIPPQFVVVDLFERGLLQLGAIFGLLGHTYVNLAGQASIGCPIAMGILDIGQIVGPDGFNHTGSIGLGFWEDNLPNWITFMDPALSILTFLKCGNIFYPIPGVFIPVPKTFQLWGLPWFFPGAYIFTFSFFFGDFGGCFFLKGSVNYMTVGPTKWLFVIPMALKMLAPSWLFVLTDVVIRGQSIKPCWLGICKATINSGQFSIAGPLEPMLVLLEQVAVAKTCEDVEALPDITWVIMGSHLTMNRQQYVVESEAYGEKECLTAFTPVFQLIPLFDAFTFGDVWIHAFYTIFDVAPLMRVGFAVSDQRYYEKNGCVSGTGQGPATDAKSMETGVEDWQDGQKDDELQRRLDAYEGDIGWKRYQNWMADLSGMAENSENEKLCAELGAPYCKCGSGFRFKEGSCIESKHANELQRLKSAQAASAVAVDGSDWQDETVLGGADASVNAGLSDATLGMWSTRQRFDGDDTSAATRFWSGTGGSGFSDDATVPKGPILTNALLGFVETQSQTNSNVQALSSPPASPRDETNVGSPEDEFERRKQAARAQRMEVERLARADRVSRQVEPGELEQMRFLSARSSTAQKRSTVGASASAGSKIELTTEIVTSRSVMRELYRNVSMVLASWAPDLNVTEEQLKGWWRGESEEFIRYQRAKVQHEYDANLQRARLLAHSFKVKNLLNKRLLRKVAAQMTVDAATAEEAFQAAQTNIDGPVVDNGQLTASAAAGSASVQVMRAALDDAAIDAKHAADVDTTGNRAHSPLDNNKRSRAHASTDRVQTSSAAVNVQQQAVGAAVTDAQHNTPMRMRDITPGVDAASSDRTGGVVIRRNPQSGEWEAMLAAPELKSASDDAQLGSGNAFAGTTQHAVFLHMDESERASPHATRFHAAPEPAALTQAYEQLGQLQQTWSELQGIIVE